VALEFAWGSASGNVSSNDASVSNANTADETPPANTTVAFNGFVSIRNHVRTGSFAKASTNRASAGATYYGILEMSGNMYENVICVTREEGRNFEGKYHGDGELVEKATMRSLGSFNEGDEIHNTPTWPPIFGTGLGARGGSVMTQRNIIRLSDRYVTKSPVTGDQASVRGVRTAP
jgi:hypothetical protein